MPNKGGKGKKKAKNKGSQSTDKRLLTFKGEMEEYAKIIKSLGDRKMTVVLPDSSEMLALIPGRFRKRCWMSVGDVVLISRRDFQDTKVDIVHKYNSDELPKLIKEGEIPEFFLDTNATQDENDEYGVTFENFEEDEDNKNIKKEDFDFDFETL